MRRAEALLYQATDPHRAIELFAGAVTDVCTPITYGAIAAVDVQGITRTQSLLPVRSRDYHTLEPGTPWDAALVHGETVTCHGKDLRHVLAAVEGEPAGPAPRPVVAALTIVPLVAGSRVVGAVALGSPSRTQHSQVDLSSVRRLARALASCLLSYAPRSPHNVDLDKKRQVLVRVMHDLRTPLSGIGLAAELMELDPPSVPDVIIEAMRAHYADLLRYMIELENIVYVGLAPNLPPPQPLNLPNVLDAALWRVKPYARRREQELLVDGAIGRPLLISEHHLEQALAAVLFDVSALCAARSPIRVSRRLEGQHGTIAVSGTIDRPSDDIQAALVDPYLRAEPGQETAGLMSLAAAERMLRHYGGDLSVSTDDSRLRIVLTVPVAVGTTT